MQRIFEERGIRAEDTLLEVTRVLFSDSPRIPDPHRAETFARRAREAEKREGWKTPHLYRLRFAPKEAAETYDFVWTFVR